MKSYWTEISFAAGSIIVRANDEAVTRIDLDASHRPSGTAQRNAILRDAETQLKDYFSGRREEFDLPLAPEGTDFQMKVWNALTKIPFGQSRTYGQIAKSIRRPEASRAVGAACGRNPIPIVIPCHRVVGSTGKLIGFGGGLPMKEWLLTHEGISLK